MISYGSWVVVQTKRDKQKKALFEKHLKEVAQKNKEELEQKAKLKLAKKSENKSSTETTLHFENEVQRKEKSQLNNDKNNSSLTESTNNSNSSSLNSDHRKHRKRRERQRHAAADNVQILIHQTANNELRIKRPSIRQKIFGQKPTQLHYDYVRSMKAKDTSATNASATLTQTKKKKVLLRVDALSGPQLVRTGSAP
ncbi:uncharacterized protein LOC119671642 [Teleopsis dalmanni]|uniref:uncharacterized protein LOC119671642 n=1 Tax=Teleopsis dalmanni TaxID=139649 RepID=UPI0018CE9F09|nr:uncharacterized protein LOC119671642 [Teleopsis dalmanni]